MKSHTIILLKFEALDKAYLYIVDLKLSLIISNFK
jgi:hypothetical protein